MGKDIIMINNKTQGLCNTCSREIPASIYEKNGQILMRKDCLAHGTSIELIEKDPSFYKWFVSVAPQNEVPFTSLLLEITYRCNLDCKYCFSLYPNKPDMTFSSIEKVIKNFKGKTIELSGGEPTLRDDLTSIISVIKKSGKYAVLQTNGIKLSDLQQLKELKDAGLDEVIFSLDSLRDQFYESITTDKQFNILGLKKKALLNLEHENIPTALSATICRGLNDHELGDLFAFGLQKNHFIRQVRFRNCVNIGSNANNANDEYVLSELLDLFASQSNIDKETLQTKLFKARLGRSIIFEVKNLEVKIVGWPTIANADLQDMKTAMAYPDPKSDKLQKVFHGKLLL